tara:strand:- start:57457 stop:57723 length:267 start_codon:yes stop_codon:yes gene_type:complete
MQAPNIGLYKTQYDHKPLFLYAILDGIGLGEIRFWLGWQDSNLRMTGSKPVALPLGYTPMRSLFLAKGPVKLKANFEKMQKSGNALIS